MTSLSLCDYPTANPMTISEDARTALENMDVTRDEAVMIAKATALSIIEDSEGTDTPLEGLVYDVWGLYNDGSPKCRFTAPYENNDIVFSGQFRVKGADSFVVKREVIDSDRIAETVQSLRSNHIS